MGAFIPGSILHLAYYNVSYTVPHASQGKIMGGGERHVPVSHEFFLRATVWGREILCRNPGRTTTLRRLLTLHPAKTRLKIIGNFASVGILDPRKLIPVVPRTPHH